MNVLSIGTTLIYTARPIDRQTNRQADRDGWMGKDMYL